MTAKDPQQDARQSQDLDFQTVYAPPFYPDPKEGRGRWVTLYVAEEPLGILWTNDAEGLGFIATTPSGIVRNAEFAAAFSKAREQGTPASVVFDYYADRAGLGLTASPVETGDLNTLEW